MTVFINGDYIGELIQVQTSSMNKTPGTSSAIPWSMYLFTTLLISVRSLSVISVFLGLIN